MDLRPGKSKMNKGGAPKGKRASTDIRERERREAADPALRHQRLEEDAAKRRRFAALLAPKTPNILSTCSSEGMPMDTLVPEYSPSPATEAVITPSSSDLQSIPLLPKARKDREENTVCSYRYSGRDFRLTDVHGRVLEDLFT